MATESAGRRSTEEPRSRGPVRTRGEPPERCSSDPTHIVTINIAVPGQPFDEQILDRDHGIEDVQRRAGPRSRQKRASRHASGRAVVTDLPDCDSYSD